MAEEQKQKANGWASIVFATILSATVLVLSWACQSLYALHADLAGVKNQTLYNTEAIRDIQKSGSPIVQAVMVRLDALYDGQRRIEDKQESIEKKLETHMAQKP